MDEEALKYSFDLFVKDGYKDSFDDYKKLISTDKDALEYSHKLFVNDGYKDGIEDYKTLIGVGGTTPDLKKKDDGELPVDGGSSGLPKIKYNGKEYGYNATTLQVFEPDGTELKQVQHLGKTYDVKDYLTNVIGVKPQTQKPQAEKPISGQKPFEQGLLDRQQGAIIASQAPEVQSDRLIKRNKKFPSIKDNPQVVAAFDAYDKLKNAAAKTADKQNEYDLFLKTGTFTDESGQDIRPLGAIPTDVLGTTTVVEGSPAAEIKKKLENDLKVAKEDENKAYDDLGNKENTFKNVKVEQPVKKELGADKYEYEMPSQVGVLNFMQSLSDLEDHADGLGMSLPQYSDSVENIASDAFLSPDQQNLFKELNSGDERAARSAIARYDENIDKQINAINKQLALGATPAQKAYLINERTRLTDEKSDFFSPKKAIEGAMTINPQLKPVFDAFVGIGDQDKASLVYAKVFKDSQDLADELIGQPLFIDQDGKQVLNPKVTDYLVGGQDSPFRRKSADKRELLQKNINTLNLLAKATLLNRRPLEKKGSFIESFGKTLAKGIGFDTGFTQTMVETDKPSVVANFLADATISTKDLPTNQAKQLEQIGKQSNWEFAGSTLGYLIPAGVQLAVGGAELRGLELLANALKRTSTAADLAYDIIKITKGSSMLSKAVKMGADAQLGGWTFNDPEMGFANIGAESLAGELFEKAIKKLPGGALVTKVAKKVFADNYLTAMNKIGKANAYGLGETTGEFAGSLVQLYQDSDTWNDFYDKFQQQFGKAEENLKFFLSCYSLGTVTGNHAAPATKAIDSAADKAYQKLTPDEKKIADEVIENDVDATNVATVDVLRNNVQVVPDADLKTRIEQVKKAKADLDALPDLKANTQNAGSPYVVPSKQGEVKNAKDGAYEIKVGDITLSGNTPEQLANDKDLINSLDLIYSGEQQRREAEGITVETPPIAEADQGDVKLAKPEAGVGVEGEPTDEQQLKDIQDGNVVTFEYKSESEVPDVFKDKISSSGETNGKPFVRVTVAKSLADFQLNQATQTAPTTTTPSPINAANAPEAGVDIQTKQKETEAKIKRKDLFADGGSFANQLGGSGENSVPTNHREVDGIEFVEFSNPTSGVVDVVMTGTSDTDFVGYYRIYENGKPTNKWSSKFENQSRNKANFKTMISGAQEMLPQGHEYTEKTSISTDGLRVWGQQLERGYELQRDANGKLKTNRVAINGDAIENELGIPVNKGNFDNVSVTNNADMKKVKAALLPYLQKFGLDENNIHFENGTVEIDLPVLKQTTTTQAAPTTTTQTTTKNQPQEVVTEPTKAPVIKAQVVGTTAGFNTIIDGGLGKQQDPRFTGEVQQGKSIFKVNPNNNESSFLDISLPSYDTYGRNGGIQIRFELPNGVDANTVFEAVKKEAAKLGQLDAKDPDFQQKVQGLVDKGIAEIQGLATGGAGQTAQVKEVVSDTQVTPTTNVNPALKNVASTATALSKLDKGTIDATLPMQPLEIDGYKREYRTDDPISIAEAYHKAKADKSNPDLVKAVEELLAPKGEVELNEGDKVGVRLNLNIRKTTGENVLSVHDRSFRGKVLGYSKAMTLRNVKFSVNENAAEKIASGESDKFPMASVDGEYVKTDKHNTDGVEIYFNPKVSKYFVDSEGKPVASAKEVSVIGNKIYATDIKYKNEGLTSLPLSELNKIPKGRLNKSAESKQKLKEDISKNGIQEPLVLIYSVKDNALRLKEGHHRLDAANSLGLTNVPVKVQVEWNKSIKDDSDIQGQKLYRPPSPLDVEGYKKRNYQPTNIELGELGFKEQPLKEAPKAAPVAEPSNTIETETKDGTKVEEIKPSKVAGFNEGVDAVKKNAEEYKKVLNEQRKQKNPSAKPARANEPVPKLFTAVSKMIADAYNSITHQPSKEEVKVAYDALVEETAAQYNFIVSKGLKVERHAGKGEPYANSEEMLKDIKENNTLKFLPNDVAFGQGTTDVSDNIGLQPSGIKLKDGYELTNSEVFRIVHDYFGHGILGNEFGAIGEENATLQHLDLYSDVAAPAVIFQTRGQNSWVNYSGVNDKANELRKKARELKKQGKPEEAKKLLEEADKIFKFAEPKIAIFPTKFNFKRYETARRIAEKAQVDSRPDKRVNGLSRLLESLSAKVGRGTRGVNKRSIREVKRLGDFYVKVKAEYTLDNKINDGIRKAFPNFKGVQKIYEVTDGKVYREMMLASLKGSPFASSVTVHSAEEFDGMRMFVTEDGSTGVTLTKEGFIGGGFSNAAAKRPNNIAQLLILGIKEGATTAEAFDTVLPDYYAQFGLKAVARVDFNDELKPDGWDYDTYKEYSNGKPDVVFFIFDGGDRNTIEDRIGLFDLYENYEKANTKQFDKDSYGDAVDFMKQAAVKRLEFDLGIEPTVEAAPTTAERKAEVASVVDKWAEKAKAALGSTSDPNIKASGLTADTVVDLIADLVKDLANLGIDAAEALKTAKAKLKELGVPDDLINEGEAKYTGTTVSPITPEQADKLLTTGPDRNNTIKALSPDVAAVAKTVTDNRGFAAFERVFNNVDNKYDDTLKALEKALGVKKIC